MGDLQRNKTNICIVNCSKPGLHGKTGIWLQRSQHCNRACPPVLWIEKAHHVPWTSYHRRITRRACGCYGQSHGNLEVLNRYSVTHMCSNLCSTLFRLHSNSDHIIHRNPLITKPNPLTKTRAIQSYAIKGEAFRYRGENVARRVLRLHFSSSLPKTVWINNWIPNTNLESQLAFCGEHLSRLSDSPLGLQCCSSAQYAICAWHL